MHRHPVFKTEQTKTQKKGNVTGRSYIFRLQVTFPIVLHWVLTSVL